MRALSPLASSALFLALAGNSLAGQAPFSASSPDVPISHRDRVYSAEQYSNTVTVVDPVDNRRVGVIRLGEPQPGNLSPLYRGQVLVHGMGFSPDRRTIAVVAIGSNAVVFIDTANNTVRHITYVGRSPHEAFYTQDGSEIWVTVRGENYVSVIDSKTYQEKTRILVPNGPGMQIFSPDGQFADVCSSFTPETVVVSVADHSIVGHVPQASPFCPNIAATPDGDQVWFTLKDSGKVEVFNARPPFQVLRTIDTGPITNHVTFVRKPSGTLAYVTIGGLNIVRVFRTGDFAEVAAIRTGDLPHGIWPSGDGSRVYVGLEGADRLLAIDTASNRIVASVPIGQAPQAVNYVPDAVPDGDGLSNLLPLGEAGKAVHLSLVPAAGADLHGHATVSVNELGTLDLLEAAVSGLKPAHTYTLWLATSPTAPFEPREALVTFKTNIAGAQVTQAIGPLRQVLTHPLDAAARTTQRFLLVSEDDTDAPILVQRDSVP